MIQCVMMDFASASSIIKHTIKNVNDLRTDESWENLEKGILSSCSKYGINIKNEKRIQYKRRFFL